METFFETLFGGKPPGDFILTWEKHNGLSSWFLDMGEAVEYIHDHAGHDIYVGCGTSQQTSPAQLVTCMLQTQFSFL